MEVGRVAASRQMGKLSLVSLRSVFEPLCSLKGQLPSAQEDPRATFYDLYRREAEEYDRDFIKKYDEDLNTTLIFVSLADLSGHTH